MNGLIGNAILEFWVCAYVSHIAWQRGHHGTVVLLWVGCGLLNYFHLRAIRAKDAESAAFYERLKKKLDARTPK